MTPISTLPLRELLDMHRKASLMKQHLEADMKELYATMEAKIPDSHINAIIDMKKELNTIDQRYAQHLKALEATHTRERIKDFIITIALSIVVFAVAFTMIYFGPEINTFLKSIFQ